MTWFRRLQIRWVGCHTCRSRREHRDFVRAIDRINQTWQARR